MVHMQAKPQRSGRTILVVEDEALVRGVTRRLLEASGHRVLLAEDPETAIALFREHGAEIDLVVTDVSMPQMSGQRLASLLRETSSDLRVLFLSGYVTTEIAVDARTDFLAKPFSREDFLAKTVTLLGESA